MRTYVGVKLDKHVMLLSLVVFSLGWLSSSIYNIQGDNEKKFDSYNESVEKLQKVEETRDKPSPHSKIGKEQISVYDNEVVIKVDNPQWAIFTDTKSMDPVIDSTSKAIEIIPRSEEDVHIGDIVAYKSEYKNGIVTHRVLDTGYDSVGWYAILKGDNNNSADPGKIRFEQIKRVVVAVIY